MPPDIARSFAGGAVTTTLAPVVLVAMVIAVVLILALPRKYVILPLFFILFLVPVSQQIYVGGVHLFVSRIIVMVGLLRLLSAKIATNIKVLSGGFNWIDRAFLWGTILQALAVLLLFLSGDALINQVGF